MNTQNNTKTENKTFMEKHGWKIAGGVGLVLVVGGVIVGKKLGQKGMIPLPKNDFTLIDWGKDGKDEGLLKKIIHRNDLTMPKPNDLGVLTMLWDEGDGPLFAAEDIKIKDAEKFLAGLQKHLEGIDPKYKGNDMVSIAVAGFHTKEV